MTEEALVLDYVESFRKIMGFGEWTIDVQFERLQGNIFAETAIASEYRRATMTFDLATHTEGDAVLKSVRHEFLHLLHCQLELYRQSISGVVTESQWCILEKVWGNACEDTVARIETMLDNFGFSPEKIEKEGKKYG